MKLWVNLRWSQTVLSENRPVVEIDGFIKEAARWIGIDYLDVLANWAGQQIFLPRNRNRNLTNPGSLRSRRDAGIECEDTQLTLYGIGNKIVGSHQPLSRPRAVIKRRETSLDHVTAGR